MGDFRDEHLPDRSSRSDVDVGSLEQLPPGTQQRIPIGESQLTLANLGGKVVAVVDLCLRCSSPLSDAALRGPILTCLHCGWQYDLDQGVVVGLPALRFERHAVRVERGRLLLSASLLEATDHLT